MARVHVTGLRIRREADGVDGLLPIDEESWGVHGPIQTQWVNKWVYVVWVSTVFFAIGITALASSCSGSNQSSGSSIGRQPSSTAAVVPPPASSTQEETATIAELAKDLSAITNMMAEQKAMAQASASATASASAATTTVVAPPPQRRTSATKQAEPACPCPPETAKKPAVDQAPSLAPTLSFAERRRNEMWSALRR